VSPEPSDDAVRRGSKGRLAPRQARSERSRRKLLDAAAAIVGESGVDGASVADIASEAGMSVGNVYRRFESKEALIRALEEEVLAGREGFWSAFLESERWRGRELVELVRAVVEEIVAGHRRHEGLLRALAAHARAEYEERVPEVGGGPVILLTERILELWPDLLRHPEPRLSIALAFEMVAATVGELVLFRRGGPEAGIGDDDALTNELTRMVMAYLTTPAQQVSAQSQASISPPTTPGRDPMRAPTAIRAATLEDAAELGRLISLLGYPLSEDEVIARWRPWEAEGNIALVAEGPSSLLGAVTLHSMLVLHRPMAVRRITSLVVDPSARGRGIGRALVAAAEAASVQSGCGLIEVTSHRRYAQAHTFYEHVGYERTSFRFGKDLG
jgi:AcrR family transcriptional regulator/GNAT superfamily N-acetyltransferase